MSNRDVATLAFCIMGLYSLVEALNNFVYGVSSLSSISSRSAAGDRDMYLRFGIAYVTLGAFLLVLAGFLILRRQVLAARVFPSEDTSPHPERTLGLHAFAYSVVGLVLAVRGLAELAGTLPQAVMNWRSTDWVLTAVSPLLQTILGIILFFGSHGLVRVWTRLRYSGLRRQMGLCLHCGYDLTGNTSGQCPECGTPLTAPAPPLPPVPQVLLRDEQMRETKALGSGTLSDT